MRHLSTIALTAALLAAPLAVVAEHADFKTWHDRLVFPELEPEPSRHTPRFADGTLLPPTITANLELTAADNPVLLPFTTLIPAHVTVTVGPGTALYAHEFASLSVAGRLLVNGTVSQPVTFTTNELHPLNQVWSGVIVTDGGQATLAHTRLQHGTPTITCLPGSRLTAQHVDISDTSLGSFAASDSCSVSLSRIRSRRDGVTSFGADPQLRHTDITAGHTPVRLIDKIH